MEEATRDWTDECRDPPESALETGERLWKAMTAWGRGLGKLFRVIGPVGADGRTATIGVRSDSRMLTTSWYKGQDDLPPVVQLPDRADLRRRSAEWPVRRREMTRQDTYAWAWLTTKDHLVESLSKTIETRRLALPSHDAVRELAWAFALAAKNQARFNPEPRWPPSRGSACGGREGRSRQPADGPHNHVFRTASPRRLLTRRTASTTLGHTLVESAETCVVNERKRRTSPKIRCQFYWHLPATPRPAPQRHSALLGSGAPRNRRCGSSRHRRRDE